MQPAATVARLHLAPFVRKPPWWELVNQQSTAEGVEEGGTGKLQIGDKRKFRKIRMCADVNSIFAAC